MASIRKNTAGQHISFQLVSTAAGAPVTAGGAGNVSKDGGAQAACAGTFTHLGTGQWDYAPTQGETNATAVGFQFTGTGAININLHFFTDNWDTTQAVVTSGTGTDQLSLGTGRVDVGKALGTAVTLDANNVLNVSTKYLAGQAVTAAAGVTFPTSVASPTNITAGTMTTTTNLTNAPTAGDFTAAMKTSLNAATPASVVGAVGSVTGNVGGSVGSVTAPVTVGTNSDKTGYTLTSAAYQANADAFLGRNVAGGSSAGRTVSQAFFALRNKWTVSLGTYTVYATDDTTVSWTAPVTGDAAAEPIVGVSPT